MSDDIHELNRKRCEAAEWVRTLGYMNVPFDYEARLASDARYRLAMDASNRAEAEYQAALNRLSTNDLAALGGGSITEELPTAAKDL